MNEYLLNEIALRINKASADLWGPDKSLMLIGKHHSLLEAQRRLIKYACSDLPLLISGESGVGKEIFAKSLYLLSRRSGKPFISLNCAQYQDENLLVSELFGHKKGSFTGAMSDHAGIFEEYNKGVIFLDEIGELSMKAQGMLLRVLAEGEVKALGKNRVNQVDVQIIAATNRNLRERVAGGSFREDLYYRLCRLHLRIPPLRERGTDWLLLTDYNLNLLNTKFDTRKQFSTASLELLNCYPWPGNVRELINIVNTGYFLCEGSLIQPEDFLGELAQNANFQLILSRMPQTVFAARERNLPGQPENAGHTRSGLSNSTGSSSHCLLKISQGENFWEAVQQPYLNRELNRDQVRTIVEQGLLNANGSYKKLLRIFNLSEKHYMKFMDFLRHHRLKPEN